MEVYNSEQEQVEALKAWWEKNGRTALAALAAFLLSVFAWQSWSEHREGVAAEASSRYQQMTELMARDSTQAMEAGRAIIAAHPDSIYAVMASMAMAKLAVQEDDLDGAAAHLQAAMERSDQPEMTALARLRLARIELAQGKHAEALATLDGDNGAAAEELRGDILLAQGKQGEARAAYTRALEGYGSVVDKRELVQMKIDDLALPAQKGTE